MMSRSNRAVILREIIHDQALVTSIVPYGESDCIVRLFSKSHGRITTFFKRGMKGKGGSCMVQAPGFADIGIIESASSMWRLVGCEMDQTTIKLSASLKGFAYAAYLCELVEKMMPEAESQARVYCMMEDAFLSLIEDGARPSLLRAVELNLLSYSGYLPDLFVDDEEPIMAFDPTACRFLKEPVAGSYPFSKDALMLARSMLIAKVGSVNYTNEEELLMIGRIFHSRLRLLGINDLKSVNFLKQLSLR